MTARQDQHLNVTTYAWHTYFYFLKNIPVYKAAILLLPLLVVCKLIS